MKIIYFLNISSITSITYVLLTQVILSHSKYCDISNLFLIGKKSLCESADESSISCVGNVSPVKTAYVQCAKGYYNERNISQQTVFCKESGEWSEPIIECFPQCSSEFPITLELNNTMEKFPEWYAKIHRRTNAKDEFPGIILHERQILTKCEYLSLDDGGTFGDHFFITVHNSKSATEEYDVALRLRTNITDTFCVLLIEAESYIKYSEQVKPVCQHFNLLHDGKLLDITVSQIHLSGLDWPHKHISYLPSFALKCFTPYVEPNGAIEVQCFEVVYFYALPKECPATTTNIIKRCKIGYQNKIMNQMNPDRLDICDSGGWHNETAEDNDCESMCGEVDKEYKPTVVPLLHKGTEIDIISAPWHVGIFANYTEFSNTGTFEQICGGSIIHTNIIISAGHCFYDKNGNRIFILSNFLIGAGKRYRSYEKIEEFQYYSRIKDVHIPPNFQARPVRNDIAVLILRNHLKYTSHVRPVCIHWEHYLSSNIEENSKGRVVGWGATSSSQLSSEKLLTINLTTITNDHCKRLVDPNFMSEIVDDRFCAKSDENATACGGDSGGGFVVRKTINSKDRYFLVGVVSVGLNVEDYCSDGFLTAFTSVKYYQDLITEAIADARNPKTYTKH